MSSQKCLSPSSSRIQKIDSPLKQRRKMSKKKSSIIILNQLSQKKKELKQEFILHQIYSILQKPPFQRTQNQIQYLPSLLKKYFVLDSSLFRDKILGQQIGKVLQLRQIRKGQPVFKYGDCDINQFYMIMQGKIGFYIPKDQLQTSLQLQHLKNQRHQHKISHKIKQIQQLIDVNYQQNPQKVQIQNIFYKDVIDYYQYYDRDGEFLYGGKRVLSEGNYFGELALFNDGPRTMLAIALQKTKVAVLSKSQYKNLINQYQKNKTLSLKEHLSFLIYYIQSMRLRQLSNKVQKLKYPFNYAIYSPKSYVDGFYIIKKGDISIRKYYRNGSFKDLVILGQKKSFGIQEFAQNGLERAKEMKRYFTARVSSTRCQLYFLSLQNFQKLCTQYPFLEYNTRCMHKQLIQLLMNKEAQIQRIRMVFKQQEQLEVKMKSHKKLLQRYKSNPKGLNICYQKLLQKKNILKRKVQALKWQSSPDKTAKKYLPRICQLAIQRKYMNITMNSLKKTQSFHPIIISSFLQS